MKKRYISPNVLVVTFNTTHSLLTVSGGDTGTLNINNSGSISTPTSVWSKEDNSWNVWGDDDFRDE